MHDSVLPTELLEVFVGLAAGYPPMGLVLLFLALLGEREAFGRFRR